VQERRATAPLRGSPEDQSAPGTPWHGDVVPRSEHLTDEPAADAVWRHVASGLRDHHVPDDLALELREHLRSAVTGVLLYGSWARGDTHADSDLDVLMLAEDVGTTIASQRISVTYYSPDQLRSATQTLFGLHLARDGIILLDFEGELRRCLASLQEPDPRELLHRINSYSGMLAISSDEAEEHLPGLVKVARYLLRSALYAKALQAGTPRFSVTEIAATENDPSLVSLLSSHTVQQPSVTRAYFEDLRQRLSNIVGTAPDLGFDTLEALAVGTWQSNRDLSNLATLALDDGEDALPYSEVPKVIL